MTALTTMTAPSTTPSEQPNPYVGPRAFITGEHLYGRDREVKELLNLMIAERIVLLYAPSGAGKTSMIQAGLIPALEKARFQVLPVMRVNLEPGYAVAEGATVSNRYMLSALLSLEEKLPKEQQLPIEQLAQMDLAGYLRRQREVSGNEIEQVLIFDQFEEILTVDPMNRSSKIAFFEQVGEALRDRSLWALFAMREDYLAALDPYRPLVSTRLGTTFRLDLLGEAAAKQAAQRPAREAGVDFTDAAAQRLVDDLRRVRVQQPDGTSEEQLGPYVEPVQLQVVCLSLWAKLQARATQIKEEDIGTVGSVDVALAGYYAERVAAIAQQRNVPERRIRDWIGAELITEQGIRGQALQEPGESQELENEVIWDLVDSHLVRAEQRRGATWFELAHDRLIEPVQRNNAAWREANLSPLQRQAALWVTQQRPRSLLMLGQELADAERWAGTAGVELTGDEREFLSECREAQANTEREERRNRLIRRLAVVSAIVGLISFVLFVVALSFAAQAREQEQISLSRRLAAQALNHADDQLDLALLLGIESNRIMASNNITSSVETRGSLLADFTSSPYISALMHGHEGLVRTVAFSPDGKTLASAGDDRQIRLWDVAGAMLLSKPLTGPGGTVYSLAFSPDGETLASAGEDGTIILWDIKANPPVSRTLTGHDGAVYTLAFKPGGNLLASGSEDGTIILWDTTTGHPRYEPLAGHTGAVYSVAFNSGGGMLASGGEDGNVIMWYADTGEQFGDPLTNDTGAVHSVAFNHDGDTLAAGYASGNIVLWDVETQAQPHDPLTGHIGAVYSLAFNSSGILASASADKEVILWDVEDPEDAKRSETRLTGYTERMYSVAFSSDGTTLASGSATGTVVLWNLYGQSVGLLLTGHAGGAHTVAFNPKNANMLASGSNGNSVIIWDAATHHLLHDPLKGHTSEVRSVAFSPDGKMLASGGDDSTIIFWDTATYRRTGAPIVTDGPVDHLAFSPDGKLLASVTLDAITLYRVDNHEPSDLRIVTDELVLSIAFNPKRAILAAGTSYGNVLLWDLEAGTTSETLSGHSDWVRSVAFSPDGKKLASGSDDTTIILWDIGIVSPMSQTLTGHSDWVQSVTFSPDGKTLASGSDDRNIILWDLGVEPPTGRSLIDLDDWAHSVAFSPDGKSLAAVGDTSADVWLWDVASRKLSATLHTQQAGAMTSVSFSQDGKKLATGSDSNSIAIWDADKYEPLGLPLIAHRGPVNSLAFNPKNGNMLASGSDDNTVIVWDIVEGSTLSLRDLASLSGHDRQVNSVAFSPDGKTLASGSDDNTVILWDIGVSPPISRTLISHNAGVNSVAFSPDGSMLATGSDDNTATIWNVAAGRAVNFGQITFGGKVTSVAFSPDSSTLAVGSEDSNIILWDVRARRNRFSQPLKEHKAAVRTLTFSPDGRVLASGSNDGVVILWDVANGQMLGLPLTGHRGTVNSVAFGPDSKMLVSGSDDTEVAYRLIRWNVSFDSWQGLACEIAGRNLSANEWAQYFGAEEFRPTCPNPIVIQANEQVLNGNREQASRQFELAVDLALRTNDPRVNNQLCWLGSLDGFAKLVLPACDRAVALAGRDEVGFYHDSRGLARALTGNNEGALEDFTAFLDWSTKYSGYAQFASKREQWITELEAARNPFDEATLRSLRNE